MNDNQAAQARRASTIAAEDLRRRLALARPNEDQNLPHIGLLGNTYTILLSGHETVGRYCLIGMHVPPGGGPFPHRHDFEESLVIIEGEIEATFRGGKSIVRTGETIGSPAGLEQLPLQLGVLVATRTTPLPKLDAAAQAAFRKKAEELAPKYRTEFLQHA
jgi:mannose-6-phosphate isomerase-like protein (cupin superfamily)